jgi:hypothetical protein
VGPKWRKSVRQGQLGLPWPSHLFWGVPDAEVDDAQEGLGMLLLDTVLTWSLSLPTRGGGVESLIPYVAVTRGDRTSH